MRDGTECGMVPNHPLSAIATATAVAAATEPIAAAALASAAVAPAAPMRGRKTIVLQCSIGDVH